MPPVSCEPITTEEAARLASALRSRDKERIKDAQTRLNAAGANPPLLVDGLAGFKTWAELDELSPDPPQSFPLRKLPKPEWDYLTGPRRFGANRSKGRAHAGVDLYAPRGTPVFAVADGKVTRVAPFYAGTHAVEVDHGDIVVRYGEVENVQVQAGDKVTRGQHIADVGHLVGISVPSDMLHLEVYDKTASGSLTVLDRTKSAKHTNGRPFYRRKDLVDPTPFLDRWKNHLPT